MNSLKKIIALAMLMSGYLYAPSHAAITFFAQDQGDNRLNEDEKVYVKIWKGDESPAESKETKLEKEFSLKPGKTFSRDFGRFRYWMQAFDSDKNPISDLQELKAYGTGKMEGDFTTQDIGSARVTLETRGTGLFGLGKGKKIVFIVTDLRNLPGRGRVNK